MAETSDGDTAAEPAADRLDVPLLARSPGFGARRPTRPWRGGAMTALRLTNPTTRAERVLTVHAGHDQAWLYLSIEAHCQDGYDTYVVGIFDMAAHWRLPLSQRGYGGLTIGCAGPLGWAGYSYYYSHSEDRDLPVPPGTQRRSFAVDGGVLFQLRLALREFNVRPDGLLSARLQHGDDGASAYHHPGFETADMPRWGQLRLASLWPADGASRCRLSRREREVLQVVADRGSLEDVAEALGISRRTVERHLENIRRKLGRPTTLECVAEALRRAWIA
ncbi:MAG: hypothetical protein HYU66_07470 [Armatimonadetes bacterium]|nr:hypothetical protein [Armatimonadota bacterium]